jgi:hypothetical protein
LPLGAERVRDDHIEYLELITRSRHGDSPLDADDYFNAIPG